jgi:hypothetical protein
LWSHKTEATEEIIEAHLSTTEACKSQGEKGSNGKCEN